MSEPKGNVLPIIWGALFMSQLIYLIIPTMIEIDAGPPEQTILFAMCGVAIFNAVFSLALPNVLRDLDKISASIIQFALLESCAVLGLVCTFLGGPSTYQYALALLGAGGMLLVFPKKEIKGRAQ